MGNDNGDIFQEVLVLDYRRVEAKPFMISKGDIHRIHGCPA